MSRSATAQKTGAFRLPLLSASQVKKTECWRRWGFERLDGFKEPQGDAAARGSAHHEEMELWSLFGKLPHSKPALAALKYAPSLGQAEIEVPVRFDMPGSPWLGYIDAAFDWHTAFERFNDDGTVKERMGKICPITSTGHTVIQDYKFTGSLRNAKEPAFLLEEEAANIYAYEAFEGGARKVSGRWVYIQMTGSPSIKEVWFDFVRETVYQYIADLDSGKGKQIQSYYASHRRGELNVLDLPMNTSQCYAYRQQCPQMDRCKPNLTISLLGAEPMNDFKASIAATFPGATAPTLTIVKKAPPLPPKRPIDVSWERITKELTTPEAGFVNPPEAPTVAATSPEHAVELQGIVAPVPEVPVSDDLDALSRDQLKALAISMGAVPETSRAREPTLKEAIRRVRASGGAAREAAIEASVASISSAKEETITDSIVAIIEQAAHVAPVVEEKKPAVEDTGRMKGTFSTTPTEEPAPSGFTLYVNCAPLLRDLEMRDIMVEASKLVKHHHNVDDYRLIPFGAGAGSLCVAIKIMNEAGFFSRFESVIIDSRTPEGTVLLETLSSLASEIVRGF